MVNNQTSRTKHHASQRISETCLIPTAKQPLLLHKRKTIWGVDISLESECLKTKDQCFNIMLEVRSMF